MNQTPTMDGNPGGDGAAMRPVAALDCVTTQQRGDVIAPHALVTGAFDRVANVAMALKRAGFTVAELGTSDDLDSVCATAGPASVNCYVQLPWEVESAAQTAVERLGHLLSSGLVRRFETAARVLPLLRPHASVVLAIGHRLVDSQTPDDGYARQRLLRLLSRAIRIDRGGAGLRVVVVDDDCPSEQIAALATDRGTDAAPRCISKYRGLEDGSNLSDWRQELLSRWASPD